MIPPAVSGIFRDSSSLEIEDSGPRLLRNGLMFAITLKMACSLKDVASFSTGSPDCSVAFEVSCKKGVSFPYEQITVA